MRLRGFRFRLVSALGAAVGGALLYGLPLFAVAGTWDWTRAWIITGVLVLASFISTLCISDEVIRARLRTPIQRGQPRSDVLLMLLLVGPSLVAWYVAAPIDRFHLDLLPEPPFAVAVAGLLTLLVGFIIATLALRENEFASGALAVQREHGHHVVDTGVYRVVRHPLYAGALGYFVGIPLWLGSWTGTALALLPIGGIALRIRIEERLLVDQLEGYRAYIKRVRWRMIPHVW